MNAVVGLFKIPDLRKRLLFTLGMLAIYRLGVHVPTPGIDKAALAELLKSMQGTVVSWFNLFSGGALERFSILALGVMPYISSSIIFQLLTVVIPQLGELQKEGEQGRKKLTQYTRYGTVLLALIQSYGIATALQASSQQVVLHPGLGFKLMTMVTLTTGTIFLMWVGELMSERGIGNGISFLIYAGIAARVMDGVGSGLDSLKRGDITFLKLLIVLALIIGTFFIIIMVERGERRVEIQHAKRLTGRKVYGGQASYIPLKVNTAGVIPPIFASSLIMFPATFSTFLPGQTWLRTLTDQIAPGSLGYEVLFVGLIIFFAYFYTAVAFKTDEVAENLHKSGASIPGFRPGVDTANRLDYILSRITLGGAIYIAAICVLPTIFTQTMKVPFLAGFGGTSVLILVGVALDTLAQIETFLMSNNYSGFMKHARIQGRTVYSS
jgi:preprotein translocase subunit SecY